MKSPSLHKAGILRALNILAAIAGLLALGSLAIEFGFHISAQTEAIFERVDLLVLFFFMVQFPVRTFLADDYRDYLRVHWFQALVMLLLLGHMVSVVSSLMDVGFGLYFSDTHVVALTKITVVVSQVLVIATLISGALYLNRKVAALKFHPSQTLFLSFFLLITFGALCLMMPRCREAGHWLSFLDALFTSTSATCVTGLVVVDTGSFFTLRGQLVILTLIQVGGLGVMTLSSFFALFFAGGVGVRERVLLLDMLNLNNLRQINTTLRQICLWTLAVEMMGALLLFFMWGGRGWSLEERAWRALFHSVSAFCNAGFALFPDSLVGEAHNGGVMLLFSALIILGGLGFATISELVHRMKKKEGFRPRLSVQTRLIVYTTGILLVGGTLAILVFQPIEGGFGFRLLHAYFSAVTARTAGFNAIDFGLFNTVAVWCMLLLMFIGASPGSTGGGLKTATLAILCARMWATIRGEQRLTIFFRNIPDVVTGRALVVFAFSVSTLCSIVFLLLITEQAPLEDVLFEAVSAFSTTGLSRGLTTKLSEPGKVILIVAMFMGRLGPLTLAFAITAPRESYQMEYPNESVMVG